MPDGSHNSICTQFFQKSDRDFGTILQYRLFFTSYTKFSIFDIMYVESLAVICCHTHIIDYVSNSAHAVVILDVLLNNFSQCYSLGMPSTIMSTDGWVYVEYNDLYYILRGRHQTRRP